MLSRRQSAVLELFVSVASLAVMLAHRRRVDESDDDRDGYAVGPIAAGALSAIANRALYDRNVGGVRDSRLRRGVFGGIWALGTHRLHLDDELSSLEFSIGAVLGTVGYRLWYGVLRPPPE